MGSETILKRLAEFTRLAAIDAKASPNVPQAILTITYYDGEYHLAGFDGPPATQETPDVVEFLGGFDP